MIVDLGCALVIGLLAFLGYRKGFLLTALSVGGLLLAYAGAYALHRPAGRLVGRLFALQPFLADMLGGFLVFSLALGLSSALAFFLRRRKKRLRAAEPDGEAPRQRGPDPDRIAGALLGGLYGAGMSVLGVWALLLLQSIGAFQTPEVARTVSGRVARPLIGWFAYALVHKVSQNQTAARAAARVVSEPRKAVSDINAVVSDPRFQSLFADVRLMDALGSQPEKARANPAVAELSRDPRFLERAAFLGLVDPAGKTPASAEQAVSQLATRLAPVARTVRTLAANAEIQKLVADPGLRRKLERQDLLLLANDPGFNRIAALVLETLRAESGKPLPEASAAPSAPAAARTAPEKSAAPAPPPAEKPQVYKWVDKQGVIHYSQLPRDER